MAEKKTPSFTYGLGNPKETRITKPGQTLPTTKPVVAPPAQATIGPNWNPARFRMGEERSMAGITPTTPPTQPPSDSTKDSGSNAPAPVDIVDTTSVSGNISEYGTSAPTYTAPTPTAEELLAQAEMKRLAEERQNALDVLTQRYKQFGLEGLVDVIKKLVLEGASEATITFTLQETPEYKQRFRANQTRLSKNLSVLSPAEYIAVEDGYRQVLRSYGLTRFDSDDYVTKFIENDMSPTELNNRVQLATQRITNADPRVATTLKNYYNITTADLVAYTLDPQGQLPVIENQIASAEIGVAALRQGLDIGQTRAESLRQLGVTEDQAIKGFATIADVLPTAQKLTDIYKDGLEGYGLEEAQGEVFGQLASEKRKRERLVARETAAFASRSGVSQMGLNKPSSAGLI